MMQQVEGKYPPPHARYLVQRGRLYFVATPCYGMHKPWWVAQTADKEMEPVAIEPTDAWVAIEEIVR